MNAPFTPEEVARALRGRVVGKNRVRAASPGAGPGDESFEIKFGPQYADGFTVNDYYGGGDDWKNLKDYVRESCGQPSQKSDDPFQLVNTRTKDFNGAKPQEAKKEKPKLGPIVKTYDYTEADRTLLYQVTRHDPKDFRQRIPDGRGGWINKSSDRIVLYRWPDLIEHPDATVFVCEGEKDADRLASLGQCATTIDGRGNWTPDCVETLRGRHVFILEDNDEKGRKRALAAAKALLGQVASLRCVRLSDLPERGDVSDWLDTNSSDTEALINICLATPEWIPPAEEGLPKSDDDFSPEAPKGMSQTFFEDVEKAKNKRWIIKGVIAQGETSSWIAPPGKGKSALLTDLAVHAAQGKDWRGYKAKKKCGVVYFALERGDLVKRRLHGHKLRDDLGALPISVVSGVLNLAAPASKDIMLNTIRDAEKHFGCSVGLIIIDPFAKGIAAGGGDEDKARDQNITLANLRRLQEDTDVHVAIVGHTGKDESRGARGSNAHVGDADAQIQIKGNGIRIAEIIKANDQAEGALTHFKLEVSQLGIDEDGDAISTAILSVRDDVTAGPRAPAETRLSAAERRALDMLVRALNEEGKTPPSAAEYHREISKIVTLDTWREYCRRGGLSSGENESSFRQAFRRAHTSLMNKQKIGCWDNNVWIAHHKTEASR
jgi:hypothetical protein